jgi:hypothetical protein
MIGLTSFTEWWEKVLDLDKFVIFCLNISDRITTVLRLFDSNFKNTVNIEVESDVR